MSNSSTSNINEISTTERGYFKQLFKFLLQMDTIIFLTTVFVSGTALNLHLSFLFLLMSEELHSTTTPMTLTLIACMITEIIAYPLSARFTRVMGGPVPVIITGIASYFPRFIITSYIREPWLMIPLQCFHAFGLPFSWAAQMEFIYQGTPDNLRVTIINLVASIHFVGSSAVANVVGGIGYRGIGGGGLFRVCGCLTGFWALVLFIRYYRVQRKENMSQNIVRVSSDKMMEMSH